MLSRKEAYHQMVESRNKILSNRLRDILDYIEDNMQVAINQGHGMVYIDVNNFNIDDITYDLLADYIKAKGFVVSAKYFPVHEKVVGITIKWDLPLWRRIL